jgi:cold shock CspA family protein
LYFDKDYGLIRSINDGLEIYFHKHSVLNGDFTKLAIGTGVSYREEHGEKGPQATFIKIVDNQGVKRPQMR